MAAQAKAVELKTVQPTIVNGVNVDDLLGLIESVRRNAANGMTKWRVATTRVIDALAL